MKRDSRWKNSGSLNAVNPFRRKLKAFLAKIPTSIGIKEAKHEIIPLTDADCVPASEFAQRMRMPIWPRHDHSRLWRYYKRPGLLNG